LVLETPLSALEKAVRDKGQDPEALENLARYLFYTDSDDPSERRAKQLAADAAERGPTVSRYYLAASLAEERGALLGFAERAYALSPTDPEAIFLRASAIMGGPVPEDALALLDKIAAGSEHYFEARTLRATILRAMELTQSAYREMERAQASAAGSVAAFRALAEAAAAARRDDDAWTLRRQLLAIRFDDIDTRRAVVDDAVERGQANEALEHAEILRQLAPGSVSLLRYLGSVYDALRRDDLALATYRKATELSPENAVSWVVYGQALLRAQYRPGAIEAFRKALSFRPQDAETRELLEQLQKVKPAQRFDEAYAISASEVRAARHSSAGYSATVLQDLTVKTVFENGLGSSFYQLAVQVHDKEGTRQWQSYPIQYDPDSQRVDLRLARIYRADGQILESVQTVEEQLGEPWYRIYYDTRALVAVFPNLEPGDTIELRYRVDDIAHRNLFADYFGDLHPLQRALPVARARYVLVSPAARAFYFHQPNWPGLQHTQKTTGQLRIDDFTVQNVPAMPVEPAMPGITEISPYLHVSTYRSWSDVGRWYFGLIKDQLYADEALKRVVQQLTKDAPDTRTKLQRIHRWVVRNTRYVALEFGIHGFLPYRAPLVVQRGFGDCKDKASLLYTMLREAGIDARVVLARTRHNGAIDQQPASLAVFDHAITYLPEFDLYVDPTAEHHGINELPVEDQGIMVLLVGPQGSELRRTPVLGPDRNRRTRTLQARLAADGSAHVEGAELVAGDGAARYREYYQAPGTRLERLERDLAADYPGVELLAESFETLDDLDKPVRFTFRARVPQLGRWDGDELRLALCSIADLIQAFAPAAERHYPLDLRGTSSYIEARTVQIPSGMRATDVPSGGEVRSEFGRLRIRFRVVGRQLISETDFELTRDRVSPEQYPAFRRWVEAADQLLRQRVTIRRGEP
jgi:transglutaminase-like putative cysteine protease/Flp pilus assembly protein TadD